MSGKFLGLALAAGLLGGVLFRYIAPSPALAQAPIAAPKEIRAQSFTLVGPADQTVATFTVEYPDNRAYPAGRVVLRDPNGHEMWSAGGSGFKRLTVNPVPSQNLK